MVKDLEHFIGETTDYDKKQQIENNKPKSWCKSVSAFANGRSGFLIFGVADDDTVTGLENPQLTAERFSEIVKTKLDPVPEFTLSFEKIDGKTLMIVALIHRSYIEIGGEVHIDIFDDRIEISSPGGMYENKPVQDCDILRIRSRRRNPILADIFSRLKYMERRGSGFKKICQDYCLQSNYREELHPKFYSDNYDFVLTLYNLNYGVGNGATDMIPQSSPILAEQLSIFLNVLRKFPGATIEFLAKESDVSDRMVKKYLKLLKDQGITRRAGSNRKGYWEIMEQTD